MRESLTILAILLIVVLTTALVGPYFIDWNAHRGEIEQRLSSLLGAKVTIAGPIDVELLPRPIFKLQKVRLAGSSPQAGAVSADRLDIELALTAVLRGQIQFVTADLTRPRVVLSSSDGRSVGLPGLATADPDRVAVESITIHDGTLAVKRDDGSNAFALTGIEGEGGAESLVGPFHFAGRIDTARGRLPFRLATGSFADKRLRLKLAVDASAGMPATDVEGTVSTAATASGASLLAFDGSVAANGTVPLKQTKAVIPWRVAARIKATPGHVQASQVEWRGGVDDRAFVADGVGEWNGADLGRGAVALALRTQVVDVGKLAVLPDQASGGSDSNSPKAPALTVAQDVDALKAFVLDPDAFAGLPIPVDLDFAAETVSFGSQTVTGLSTSLRLTPAAPVSGRLAVTSADGTAARFDGSLETGPAALFKGRAQISSHSVRRFADGLTPDLPQTADWIRETVPADAFDFSGALELSGVGFAARDASLTLDHSHFSGTLTLTRAVGQDRARFFADLTSDALDLDALPNWRGAAEAVAGLDLSLSLSARAVQLARTDLGAVEAGRIAVQVNKTDRTIVLDHLNLSDLGGATADFTGRSDGRTAHVAGRFDVRKLHDLASLLQRIAPGATTAGLLARAEALSPALLKVSADADISPDDVLSPTALSLEGTAAGTAVNLRLQSTPAPQNAPDDPLAPLRSGHAPVSLALTLDAPEAGALLRQIGLSTQPATTIGHGHIEVAGRVGSSGTLDGRIAAAFGTTAVTFQGRGQLDQDFAGHVTLHGPNVAPLARAIRLASPDNSAIWPVDLETDLALRERRFVTSGLAGQIIGTPVKGELSYVVPAAASPGSGGSTGAEAAPALTGNLTLDRLPLPILAGLILGPLPPPKAGAVWPDTPFGPPFANLPNSALALTAKSLPLDDATTARDARLTLRLNPGVLTIDDLAANLGDGQIGATLTFRREAAAASLAGHLEWTSLALATPALAGRSSGAIDLAGTGPNPAALAGSLGGNGSVTLTDGRLPRFDPGAITRVLTATDAAGASLDPGEVAQQVSRELDKGAFDFGTLTAPTTLAAGVLRLDAANHPNGNVMGNLHGALDLRTLALNLRASATDQSLPSDWSGDPPQISVVWSGPFTSPQRRVESANLVSGLAARAITRDQARIDAFQDDIRERAFFARRLKAIEAEAAEKAAAARAETERQNKADQPAAPPDGQPGQVGQRPVAPPALDGKAGDEDGISKLLREPRQAAPHARPRRPAAPMPPIAPPFQAAAPPNSTQTGAAGQQY